jgi:beta-aspartyl-peptidase (threonine type)
MMRAAVLLPLLLAALPALLLALPATSPATELDAPVALVVHGGAGTMSRDALGSEQEAAIRADLERALDAGQALLHEGRPALDAVIAAVQVLEDSPYFNAGHGAVFAHEGHNELDAALMDGATRRAGAVAGVRHLRNPIRLAQAVMQRSPHVMLTGEGAERFARSIGMELVDSAYFHTEYRWQQLQAAKAREAAQSAVPQPHDAYFGTVGAVALDRTGNVAAATSTGGMTNKRWGRVGDAPIIGAGTWADAGCAVSATGWGEFFIRLNVAADICARVHYRGDSLAAAAEEVVMKRVPALGGDGGVIAIDAQGNIALPFNTSGMYRGWVKTDGSRGTAVFAE